MDKAADLLPDVKLQEHQQRLADEARESPVRKLLVHALGSGKTLTSLGMAEARGEPYTAVVPASLRANFKKEQAKWTDEKLPSNVMSYTELAKGKDTGDSGTLIFDEAHRLRNPGSQQSQEAQRLAKKVKQLVMLTGTPIVNEPGDLAVPLGMLSGKKMSPAEFNNRYVGTRKVYPHWWRRLLAWPSGTEPVVKHEDELKALLKGHVDWYDPGKPVVPVKHEDIPVTMGVEQSRLYRAMWDQLPFWLRWKLKNDYPLTRQELVRMQSFLTGPRQVGLSTYPYMKNKDPWRAFNQSAKLQEAHRRLLGHLKDPRTKALVFANFIDAGLTPYAAALERSKVPHAVFHGGLSDAERKKLVDDYNADRLRVALIGPSGTEGLSFRGTQLVQQLDPYWNPIRGRQAVGRGLRFDSHLGLPEDLKNVLVERYVSRLPMGFKDRLLGRIGMDRTFKTLGADDHLRHMEEHKEQLNRKFYDLLRAAGTPQ